MGVAASRSSQQSPSQRPQQPTASGRQSSPRSSELDGIRGVAVISVFAHHLMNLSGNPLLAGRSDSLLAELSAIVRGGGLGIDMFFVLSAYLLGRVWIDPERPADARDYFWRRARRVLPAYYAALLIPLLFMTGSTIPYSSVATRDGLASIGNHLLLVQYLFPVSADGFVVHGGLWTLTIEALLYVTIPILARAFMGRRWVWSLPVAVAVSLAWRFATRGSLDWLVDLYQRSVGGRISEDSLRVVFLPNQFPSFLADFAVGLAACSILLARRGRTLAPAVSLTVGVAGVAALLAGFWLDGAARPEQLSFYGKHVATAIGTGLLITVGVAGSGSLRGAMRWRPIVWFGERGYGVFLWHLPVIWALLGFPMVEIDGSRSGMLELALWTVPITCLLAEATYRLIEQPAMGMPRPPLASLVRHPPWFLVPFAAGLLIFGWWIVSSAVA